MFASKAGAYSSKDLPRAAPLEGRLLALPEGIMLGQKGFPGENTQSNLASSKVLEKKVLQHCHQEDEDGEVEVVPRAGGGQETAVTSYICSPFDKTFFFLCC